MRTAELVGAVVGAENANAIDMAAETVVPTLSGLDTAEKSSDTLVTPSPNKRVRVGFLKRILGFISACFGLLEPAKSFVVNLGIILAILFGVPAIYRLAVKPTFVIKDISVPSALESRGYSGSVIAQELLDRVAKINETAGSKKEKADITGIDLDSSLPAIDLPVGGISLTTVISELRQLLGVPETKITGEVVIVSGGGDDKSGAATYGLHLRVAGKGPLSDKEGASASIEQLVDNGAQMIMHRFDPINLGYYYFRTRDFDRAYEITEEALSDDASDNDPWAYSMRGLIAKEQGDLPESIKNVRQAIELQDNFWIGYVNLSGLLLQEGNLQEAEAAARKAIELASDQQEGHAALALVLLANGDKDQALKEAITGTKVDPKDPGGYLTLGKVLVALQKYDDAIKAFATSDTLDSTATALIESANVERLRNRHDKEQAYLEKATEAEPKNADVWIALGKAQIVNKDLRRAAVSFAKAEALDPLSGTLLTVVKSMIANKLFVEANQQFVKNSARFEHDPEFLIGWSELFWAEGKKAEASAKLHLALANCVTGQSFEDAGHAFEEHGEIPDAINAYQTALQREPQLEDVVTPIINRLKSPSQTAPGQTHH